MNRYSRIQSIVQQLTGDDTFRTFYTLYLMAESESDREILGNQFWKEVELLTIQEQQAIRAEFTRTFLRLPKLLEDLRLRVNAEKIA